MGTEIQSAARGVGPLLQRDYWAVLGDCRLSPSELIAHVKEHFCELPPQALVRFSADAGIVVGSDLAIDIVPAHHCLVRVVHQNDQSFTLATLAGHPEAGRITFGAYRNPKGAVVFHIRSRARSWSTSDYIGFLALGDAMQTNTWADFITNAAASAGAHVRGAIHADRVEVEPTSEDDDPLDSPTYQAVGD